MVLFTLGARAASFFPPSPFPPKSGRSKGRGASFQNLSKVPMTSGGEGSRAGTASLQKRRGLPPSSLAQLAEFQRKAGEAPPFEGEANEKGLEPPPLLLLLFLLILCSVPTGMCVEGRLDSRADCRFASFFFSLLLPLLC